MSSPLSLATFTIRSLQDFLEVERLADEDDFIIWDKDLNGPVVGYNDTHGHAQLRVRAENGKTYIVLSKWDELFKCYELRPLTWPKDPSDRIFPEDLFINRLPAPPPKLRKTRVSKAAAEADDVDNRPRRRSSSREVAVPDTISIGLYDVATHGPDGKRREDWEVALDRLEASARAARVQEAFALAKTPGRVRFCAKCGGRYKSTDPHQGICAACRIAELQTVNLSYEEEVERLSLQLGLGKGTVRSVFPRLEGDES